MWINFNLDAQVSAANTNFIGYMGPNAAADAVHQQGHPRPTRPSTPTSPSLDKLVELLDLGADLDKYTDALEPAEGVTGPATDGWRDEAATSAGAGRRRRRGRRPARHRSPSVARSGSASGRLGAVVLVVPGVVWLAVVLPRPARDHLRRQPRDEGRRRPRPPRPPRVSRTTSRRRGRSTCRRSRTRSATRRSRRSSRSPSATRSRTGSRATAVAERSCC